LATSGLLTLHTHYKNDHGTYLSRMVYFKLGGLIPTIGISPIVLLGLTAIQLTVRQVAMKDFRGFKMENHAMTNKELKDA
jgi:hypothetical protein